MWRCSSAKREFDRCDAKAIEQGQVSLLVRLQVMECDPGEIGDDDVTRDLVLAARADEIADVTERLRLGLAQVSARGSCAPRAAFRARKGRCRPYSPESFLTGSSNAATMRRETPKTAKNSFQNVCFSACSLLAPAQSRAKRMALCANFVP